MASNILEEKLREASCLGDIEAVEKLLTLQNVDVNSQNSVNGWTALHWACKRGNERVIRLLLTYGADKSVKNYKQETPSDICTYPHILNLLGEDPRNCCSHEASYVPNYAKNPPLNSKVDLAGIRLPKPDICSMPKTALPSAQNDELILKARIHGSSDPDFIEIELPKYKLTYNDLLTVCCEELQVPSTQVERIRKLPDTRIRKDNDVRRLTDYQSLELVLKGELGTHNCYQSISTCKDQTILY